MLIASSSSVEIQVATTEKNDDLTWPLENRNIENGDLPIVVPEKDADPIEPQEPAKNDKHGCVYPNMCLECIFFKEDASLLEALSTDNVANPEAEFAGLLSRYAFDFKGMAAEANINAQLFEIKKDWVKVRIGVMWYGNNHKRVGNVEKYKVKYELISAEDNSITSFELLNWMRQ